MNSHYNIEIKKSAALYVLGIALMVVLAGYFMLKSGNSNITGNVAATGLNEGAQKVVIGVKNYNYYPNTVKVKAGKPVSISLDESVYGCLRDFTIREFGVRKYLKTPQDTVEFLPTKPGTYAFSCSMGMGTGTLIVE